MTGTPEPDECRRVVAEILRAPNGLFADTLRDAFRRFDRVGDPDAKGLSSAATPSKDADSLGAFRHEQLVVNSLWAILQGTPRGQRRVRILQDRRFWHPGLVLRFLEVAAESQETDPLRALSAGRLAVEIVDLLSDRNLPPAKIEDLRARALGAFADALRCRGELAKAEATVDLARQAWARGSGDTLRSAALARTEASLRLAAGDQAAGVRLLEAAVVNYRRCGATQEEGRTLVKLARTVGYDHPAQGAALAGRAAALLREGAHPPLELMARHLHSWFLNDAGRGEDALDELALAHSLFGMCKGTEAQRLRPWLEARICRGFGDLEGAERGFAAAFHEFHRTGYTLDLTLVTLDLVETFLAQGKSRSSGRLLKRFQGTLRLLGMHGEGLAAWETLRQVATHDGRRAGELTRALAPYFRRAWRSGEPFSPPPAPVAPPLDL
jgi:hypothetical protein